MAAETERIADQLRRAVGGEAWHGPAVMEILAGVDAETAAARPIVAAHGIWEILNHMTAWSRAVLRRINGHAVELEGDDDWPPVRDASDAAWQTALANFRSAQRELLAKVETMGDNELATQTPGRKYNNLFMLDGLVQHHLYHAGQMALLKKASGFRSQASGT